MRLVTAHLLGCEPALHKLVLIASLSAPYQAALLIRWQRSTFIYLLWAE